MSYRPSFLDVLDLEVSVEVSPSLPAGTRSITLRPNGELRLEAGIEDVHDALEARYGWERFLAEVKARVLEDIAERLEVRVVSVTTGHSSDEQQQEDDLREFLMEHLPDFFE